MKGLTIEQKAEAYNLALDRAKKLYEQGTITESLSYVFPELKECNEEEVRKAMIDFFKHEREEGVTVLHYGVNIERMIAWLENMAKSPQLGEQKSADKVEPKFQNGQWIVWQDKCYKVNDNGCGYELVDQNGLSTSLEYGTIDEDAHLWDITKDARDGDVLADNVGVILFKSIGDNNVVNFHAYFSGLFAVQKDEENWGYAVNCTLSPATKEQRERFFAAMHEAGYEWDAEKKELKKISQRIISAEAKEAMYGKPTAWSEEDEKMCQETIDWFEKKCFPYALESENPARESIKWLKSLKQRYTWKPSDEQMKVLETLAEDNNQRYFYTVLNSLYEQLKKL